MMLLQPQRLIVFSSSCLTITPTYNVYQGKGFAVAQEIWPDSLLTEVPKHLQSNSSTAPATAALEIIVDSEALTDIPSPPEAIEEALLNSEASKLPFSKRAALVSALKRFQRIALGGKS
jgi:hypothetical protein